MSLAIATGLGSMGVCQNPWSCAHGEWYGWWRRLDKSLETSSAGRCNAGAPRSIRPPDRCSLHKDGHQEPARALHKSWAPLLGVAHLLLPLGTGVWTKSLASKSVSIIAGHQRMRGFRDLHFHQDGFISVDCNLAIKLQSLLQTMRSLSVFQRLADLAGRMGSHIWISLYFFLPEVFKSASDRRGREGDKLKTFYTLGR